MNKIVYLILLTAVSLWWASGWSIVCAQETQEENKKLAEITIRGELREGVANPAELLFASVKDNTFRNLISRIDKARADAKVLGLILKIEQPEIGFARTQEIRLALHNFRSSGKKIHVYFESATAKEYLIAAAANDISMTPVGMLELPGFRLELDYMKGLFDWLGLQADVIHIGKFKTAYETFYRNEMSEGQKESLEQILDGLYAAYINGVAQDRGMTQERVENAIDVGLLTAEQARGRGLLDFMEYEDQFAERLKNLYAADYAVIKNYGRAEKREIDFEDFGSIFAAFGEMMAPVRIPKGDKIAVIYAVGEITSGESEDTVFGGSVLGSQTLIKAIHEARDNSEVKAIVLRVNSPGGSALASDQIWREIILAKKQKPIIASMSDLAASGGYYISMPTDVIVADEGTLTGSIGVIGMKLVTRGLMDKIGINTQVVQRGKRAGMFSSAQPFNEEERAYMTRLLENFYHEFVTKVAAGRDTTFEMIEPFARGRVWTGKQAKELGLVDEIGGLDTAIGIAKAKAGIAPDKDLAIWELPRPKSFAEILEESFSSTKLQTQSVSQEVALFSRFPQARKAFAIIEMLLRMEEPRLAFMPIDIRFQ